MRQIPEVGEQLLSRYTLEELISSNNDIAVFRAYDTRLNVQCAIKILLTDGEGAEASDAKRKEAFLAAARSQARLNHPNIIHVTNIEAKQGVTFCVMEWLCGLTLFQHISHVRESLNTKEIIEIFISVIDAVISAHAVGVLHKRINPTNIFLNQLGNRLAPVVINFGSYKDTENMDVDWDLPYLSPEQLKDANAATEKSDIFALCATIYYAFTHRAVCELDSLDEFLRFYEAGEEIDFPDEIPDAFVPLLIRGLNILPDDRFATTAELLKYVKEIGSNFKLSANLTVEAPKSYVSGHFTPICVSANGIRSTSNLPTVTPTGGIQKPNPASFNRIQPVPSNSISLVQGNTNETAANTKWNPTNTPIGGVTPGPVDASKYTQGMDGSHIEAPQPRRHTNSAQLTLPLDLPEGLNQRFKLVSPIHCTNDQWLLRIQSLEDDSKTYVLKMLTNATEARKSTFAQAAQNSAYLYQTMGIPLLQPIVELHLNIPAFVAEDFHRQSLVQYLTTNGPLDVKSTLQIAIYMAQTLARMHEAGSLHGNLKPGNLFFEVRNGVSYPVLYDACQRHYADRPQCFAADQLPFIAPETNFNMANANPQTDIFAFGMLLNTMLLGTTLYMAQSPGQLYKEIIARTTAPSLTTLAPHIDPEFVHIIDWCTSFDPNGRYRSFNDILRDLYIVNNKYLAAQPLETPQQ